MLTELPNGEGYSVTPIAQVNRQYFLIQAIFCLLFQVIFLVESLISKTEPTLIFHLLGCAFIGLIAAYAFLPQTEVTVLPRLGTAKLSVRKTASHTHSIHNIEDLKLVMQEAQPAKTVPRPHMIVTLEIGEFSLVIDRDTEYIQWPIFLESKAIEYATALGIPLEYKVQKPDQLLSETYGKSIPSQPQKLKADSSNRESDLSD